MNHHDEEALQAWLDGAGTPEEREAFLTKAQSDPELSAALALEQRIAQSLHAQFEPAAQTLDWPKAPAVASPWTRNRWRVAAALIVAGLAGAIWLGFSLFKGPDDPSNSRHRDVANWWEEPSDSIRAVPLLQVEARAESPWGEHLINQWQQCNLASGAVACGPILPLPQEVRSIAKSQVGLDLKCSFDLDAAPSQGAPFGLPTVSVHPDRPTLLRCSEGDDHRLLVVSGEAQDPKPQVAKEAGFLVWRRALSGYVFYECGIGPEPKVLPHLGPLVPKK